MILILSAVFTPEPVVSAQISNDLAHALSVNHTVTVLCPRPTRPAGTVYNTFDEEGRSFRKITLKSYVHPGSSFIGRMIESISFGLACKKFIKNHQKEISVIYANTWPLFAQYYTVKASRKYNIPLVIHIQDIYPETLTDRLGHFGLVVKAILLPMDRFVLRHAKTVIAIGHKMAEYLSATRQIEDKKITVINNWQDEVRFKKTGNLHSNTRPFSFLFLGSISPSANVEGIIHAFGISCLSEARLVIAGSGNSKYSCLKTAKDFPKQTIEFIDAPASKAPELIAEADICLLPLKKGFGKYSIPSKLAGYMLSGKPVLAFVDKASDAANTIFSAECGWVVQPDDHETLAMKMKEIYNCSGQELDETGQRGRSYALKYLSKSTNLKILSELVEQAII